jgi:hypothetical protein
MPKLRLFIVSICAEHALSACGVLAIRANCVVPEQTMTEYPYILFNKSPEQMRILGARGGKAYGRNRRARRAFLADTRQRCPHAPSRRKPPPEPFTLWTGNFLGCGARKSNRAEAGGRPAPARIEDLRNWTVRPGGRFPPNTTSSAVWLNRKGMWVIGPPGAPPLVPWLGRTTQAKNLSPEWYRPCASFSNKFSREQEASVFRSTFIRRDSLGPCVRGNAAPLRLSLPTR